ncbi:MAG: hypothetical protein RSD28_04835 [Lachnospiraceae bacterium]
MDTLDTLIQDNHLQMMKAALPYLDFSHQKEIAMIVKFMELQRTAELFQSPSNNLHMCSEEEDNQEEPQIQMLNAIRKYCTDKEKETVDTVINFVQIFSTYGTLFT